MGVSMLLLDDKVLSTLIVFSYYHQKNFPTFTLILKCKSSTPRGISQSSLCNRYRLENVEINPYSS